MNSGFQLLKGKADGEPKWFFPRKNALILDRWEKNKNMIPNSIHILNLLHLPRSRAWHRLWLSYFGSFYSLVFLEYRYTYEKM